MGTISDRRDEAVARFEPGTFRRIAQVLRAGETRSDFLRLAIAREIECREEQQRRQLALASVAGWIA